MNQDDLVIEVRGLGTRFGSAVIHEDLDLSVRRGEVMALVGGSGSGKTTLLREIIMLAAPAAGAIRLFGHDVIGIGRRDAVRLSRRFGVLFQRGALFTSLTIRENVAVPLLEHTTLSRRRIHEIADLKIALAGLPGDAAAKLPAELSGGMVKRAGLARALALDPELLFLDEPSSGLDPVSANALDELILQLKESLKLTVMLVTHDLDSLWRVTDRVAFLGERRVIDCDSIANLATSAHPLIKEYFSGPRGRTARAVREQAWAQK